MSDSRTQETKRDCMGEKRHIDMAVCLTCGWEEYDVPLVNTEIGWRLRKKCSVCNGQLVSNPRRG